MGLKRGERPTVMFSNVTALKETGAALLCKIDGDDYWMPKSQIDSESDVNAEGDEGTLVVTQWIAMEKGLV